MFRAGGACPGADEFRAADPRVLPQLMRKRAHPLTSWQAVVPQSRALPAFVVRSVW